MSRIVRTSTGLLCRHVDAIPGGASFSRSAGLLQRRGLGNAQKKSDPPKDRDYRTVHRSSGRVVRLLAVGMTMSAASLFGLLVSNSTLVVLLVCGGLFWLLVGP